MSVQMHKQLRQRQWWQPPFSMEQCCHHVHTKMQQGSQRHSSQQLKLLARQLIASPASRSILSITAHSTGRLPPQHQPWPKMLTYLCRTLPTKQPVKLAPLSTGNLHRLLLRLLFQLTCLRHQQRWRMLDHHEAQKRPLLPGQLMFREPGEHAQPRLHLKSQAVCGPGRPRHHQ